MDVGLQVAAHDALSTSLMEPMLFQKELVCTSIYPYRKLESTFGLDMGLVDLEVDEIMRRMEELIDGKKSDINELMNRKKVIIEKKADVRKEINLGRIILNFFKSILKRG